MYKFILLLFMTVFTVAVMNCQQNKSSLLDKFKLDSKSNKIIRLPHELKEVSGLALTGDNMLYMHNDEEGIIFKFDMEKKKVVEKYELGEKHIKKDFEDIAVLNDSVYMVTSSGVLYKFSLGGPKDEIPFEKFTTDLNDKNNVEGLCYDPTTNSFLLACKGYPGKDYKGFRAVYEFNLKNHKLKSKPRFLISLDQLKDEYNIKNFEPSGIELNKKTGHFFLISAAPEVIIEVGSDGTLINAKKFDDKIHKQPEGITFLKDGTLVISDEGKDKKAKITIIKQSK